MNDEYEIATGKKPSTFGLIDRSTRGTVIATGVDVVPLLQGIVTSDVFALAEPGSGQRSCAVNSNGRLVCDLRFLHGPDVLIMDFEPGLVEGGVISHFRANVMSEDAKFTDRSAATGILGVIGADPSVLDALATVERPISSLPIYGGTWGSIDGVDVVVRRTELLFEFLMDQGDFAAITACLEQAGGQYVTAETIEILRVEAGIARWGAELDVKVIPLEAGLDYAISYNKGCYVGQEIIARLDTLGKPARLLRTLQVEDGAQAGDVLFVGKKKVGELRSLVRSPTLGGWAGLAYVKRDHNAIGDTLEIGTERVAGTIIENVA